MAGGAAASSVAAPLAPTSTASLVCKWSLEPLLRLLGFLLLGILSDENGEHMCVCGGGTYARLGPFGASAHGQAADCCPLHVQHDS